jgi:photosystem I subunit XI
MNTVIEKIDRSKDNPRDPRNREVVLPDLADPQGSNLATPINSSKFTKWLINILPAYRQGISPLRRGIEVGLAHGYWLIGPFFKFNPLRFTDGGAVAALASSISLITISALTIVLYAASNPPPPLATHTNPHPPAGFDRPQVWNQYATGFAIGGIIGTSIAYAILTNVDVFQNFLKLVGLES